jgi:hypothetical protein
MARYQLCRSFSANVGSLHRKLKAGTFCSDGGGAQQGDVILPANVIAGASPGVFVPVGTQGPAPDGVSSCD